MYINFYTSVCKCIYIHSYTYMTRSCSIAWSSLLFFYMSQIGLEIRTIRLSQPAQVWDYRYAQLHQQEHNLFFAYFCVPFLNASVNLALNNHFITIISKIKLAMSKESNECNWNLAQLCIPSGIQLSWN